MQYSPSTRMTLQKWGTKQWRRDGGNRRRPCQLHDPSPRATARSSYYLVIRRRQSGTRVALTIARRHGHIVAHVSIVVDCHHTTPPQLHFNNMSVWSRRASAVLDCLAHNGPQTGLDHVMFGVYLCLRMMTTLLFNWLAKFDTDKLKITANMFVLSVWSSTETNG